MRYIVRNVKRNEKIILSIVLYVINALVIIIIIAFGLITVWEVKTF